jgi:hypothetical protein
LTVKKKLNSGGYILRYEFPSHSGKGYVDWGNPQNMLLWNRSRSKYDAYFPIVEKEPIMS